MVKLSRNDKCLCGSGKKYKVCCLPKGIEYENTLVNSQKTNPIHSNMLISLLNNLQRGFYVDVPDRHEIIEKINKIENLLNKHNVHIATLTERMTIRSVNKKIYELCVNSKGPRRWDKEKIYLYLEALIEFIKKRSLNVFPVDTITIHSEKGRYQTAEISYYGESWDEIIRKDEVENYLVKIIIEEKNELHKHFNYYNNLYYGLEQESLKNIATATFLENQIPEDSMELFSYVGLFKYYDGVLEQEFRKVIELKEGWIFKKDYMFKKIIDYLEENELDFIHINIPNLVNYMNRIMEYRNRISHGEWITFNEFNEIKDFCFSKKAFKFISMLKCKLEQEQLQDELGLKLNSLSSSDDQIVFDIFKPKSANKQKFIKLLSNFAKLCRSKKPNFRELNKMLRMIEQKIDKDNFMETGINLHFSKLIPASTYSFAIVTSRVTVISVSFINNFSHTMPFASTILLFATVITG